MFPAAEVSQAGAEILHFARELIEAPLKFGIVFAGATVTGAMLASVEVDVASMMRSA
jgi:hypothetical protein